MVLLYLTGFYVPKNVVIKGNVQTPYTCNVKGRIEGTVKSEKNVFVAKDAVLQGNIFAKKIRIRGTVLGDVNAKDLIVYPGGYVKGKLLSPKIHIHNNGIVEDVQIVETISNPETSVAESQTWF